MSPLEWLGLGADADERMVKRAYAQRLRTTRPEDDPEGFQQLHAIYQAALAQCRRAPAPATARSTPPPALATPAPPRAPADVAATTPFDPDGFSTEAIRQATAGDASALQAWLVAQPALWSLQAKARAGQHLFAQLHRQAPPLPPDGLAVLLRFFDMDNVLAGHDPVALQRLQRRMQLAWELQPAHHGALARRLETNPHTLQRWLRQLSRPFQARQVALVGLIPEASADMARFISRLTGDHPEDLPPSVDLRQARFWPEAAARGQVNRARLLIGGTRCAAALLLAVLVGALLGKLAPTPPATFSFLVMAWVVGMAAVPCLIWAAWMAWLPFEHWHARPEWLPARWPWLNLLLVPLLCAIGLGGWLGTHHHPAALVPVGLALWLAFRRLLLRSRGGLARIAPRLIWFALFLAYPLSNAFHASLPDDLHVDDAWVFAGVALLLWGLDLWRHRGCLRISGRAA